MFRVVELRGSDLEAFRDLVDRALRGISWYRADRPEGVPLWRAVAGPEAQGDGRGPGRTAPGALGVWTEGDLGEPERLAGAVAWEADAGEVRLVPWTPLTCPTLPAPARDAAAATLLRAVERASRRQAGPTRLVQAMRFNPADRERVEELLRVYLKEGFKREDRAFLTLAVGPSTPSGWKAAADTGVSNRERETVLIDPSDAGDMALLIRLFVRCFADSPDPMGRRSAADEVAARAWLEEAAGGRKGRPESGFWRVARVGGLPAGFILANRRGEEEYYVADIGVAPEFRRQGLARALLLDVIGLARRNGGRRLAAIVHEKNAASFHLFTSAGFCVSARLTVLEKPSGNGNT